MCNHNNASLRHPGNKNQGLPSFFLPSLFPSLRTSPSTRTKPIKGLALITASACRQHTGATPWGGGRVGRRAENERAWARCGGRRGKRVRGWGGMDAFPSLTPTPEPSRHYFIVLTEMKKRDDGSSGAGWENVGSMKTPGRSGGSAQSAWSLHRRGVTEELGVVRHCLKNQIHTQT